MIIDVMYAGYTCIQLYTHDIHMLYVYDIHIYIYGNISAAAV